MTAPLSPDDPVRELRRLVDAGHFREAVEAYHTATDPGWRQNPETQLLAATSATRLGDFRTAAPLAESAESRFRAHADTDGRMRATNLLGALAWEQGRLTEAERHFDEVLRLAHELRDSLRAAWASNNLASLAQLGDRPDSAMSLYRSALISYQRLGDRRGMAETHHNLGLVFRQMERWQDAEEAEEQAVRLAEGTDDPALQALTLTGRAELYLARGELARAKQDASLARRLAGSGEDTVGGAEAGRLLALVALAAGDLQNALEEAEAAWSTAERHGSALLQGECAAATARVLLALGRTAEAERHRDEARELFQRLGAVKWLVEFDKAWQDGLTGGH
jgi:tetratricopeptide (TPR) repeat protein